MTRVGRATWAILGLALATALLAPSTSGTGVGGQAPVRDGHGRGAGLSIGLLADAQYCDCDPRGTRYYRHSLAKLEQAANTVNARDVDFTIQLGDLIDRYPKSFDRVLPAYGQFEGPRHHVLGNHDFALSSGAVVRRLGMPAEHYQLSLGAWRFVVLDTNDVSLYANPEGSADHERAERLLADLTAAGAPNAKSFNGAAGADQRHWLRRVLSAAREQGQRVVVFGHMPVHGSGMHNAWDDRAIRSTLEAAGNVVAYVHGHDHAGGYARQSGIHHLGLHGMVERSPTSNAFAVLHLLPDRLRVEGFGREPDRVLALEP